MPTTKKYRLTVIEQRRLTIEVLAETKELAHKHVQDGKLVDALVLELDILHTQEIG